MPENAEKIAVILFNLGGPDCQAAVRPFLFNLFNDAAILRVAQPFRWLLAWLISARRTKTARKIYAQMGGGSPILPQTGYQAQALQTALQASGLGGVRCFIVMRYWTPRAAAVAEQVKRFNPDHVVLLPLYPQYSSTTTGSSLAEWHSAAKTAGLQAKTHQICCFAEEPGFIAAHAALIRAAAPGFFGAGARHAARLLFSAHGLPQRIVDAGDPYPDQVARTAQAIARALELPDSQWEICYQSRVGPLQWIGPCTGDRIKAAGAAKQALAIAPIAFVSEHAETLVELDIDYRQLALQSGVTAYLRAPALCVHPDFILGLASLVQRALRHRRLCGHRGPEASCVSEES